MLRWLPVILCVASAGCATAGARRVAEAPIARSASHVVVDEDAAVSASALVFAPRTDAGAWMPDLSRADRQPSAFVGFEGPIVEYYHIETYDRQTAGGGYGPNWGNGYGYGGGGGDRYDRRAYIDKFGVLTR